jgi:hypothetical protein
VPRDQRSFRRIEAAAGVDQGQESENVGRLGRDSSRRRILGGIMAFRGLLDRVGAAAPSPRDIIVYGLASGVLITVLKLTEYRFLVVEHSVEIYAGLIAALFAGLGIWLGLTLTRMKPVVIVKEVPVAGPFVLDEARRGRWR